jgi:hypothetical protein
MAMQQVQITANLRPAYQAMLGNVMGHATVQLTAQAKAAALDSGGPSSGGNAGLSEEDESGSVDAAAIRRSAVDAARAASSSSTLPPHPLLLPKVLITPPRTSPLFTPRAWSAARRALLSCCVLRSRGLWTLDSATVRTAVDRWLLPSRAQRLVYVQHIAAYFWMASPGPGDTRKAEELLPALTTLLEGARLSEVSKYSMIHDADSEAPDNSG